MMYWFNRKAPASQVEVDSSHVVEIVAHKDASKEVIERAKNANAQLKQLFDENGFTVKIVLAMGAKQERRGEHHGR